ncbi:unnamed protein product [Heterobilharzia americana]|nr:unnamed protein product [Heterobilharzia americana]
MIIMNRNEDASTLSLKFPKGSNNHPKCNFVDSVKQNTYRSLNDAQLHPTDSHGKTGKYKIIRTIGQGNFAKVKLAIHLLTGREVAIKMIDKVKMYKNCKEKLIREVKVIKSISHPNIGEIYEYLLKNGRMSEADARSKFRQILSAVQYCHRKHIVHRDMKAENLLLDCQNDIKLADFGFANNFDPTSQLDTFCGSPPYAAPELLNGEKYIGPEVDVWALGVILYLLVSGSLPFEAPNLKELHRRITHCDYRVPYFMSTNCEKILKRMLVIDPMKRSCLEDLMTDPWINIGYEGDPLRPYIESPENYNDPLRIALMTEIGFKNDELRETFEKHLFNNVRATYLLLGDKETQHRIAEKLISIMTMSLINNSRPEEDVQNKDGKQAVQQSSVLEIDEKPDAKSEPITKDATSVPTSTSNVEDKPVDQPGSDHQNDSPIASDANSRETVAPTTKYLDSKGASDSSSCPLETANTECERMNERSCKTSNGLRRIHASSLYENTEGNENEKVIICKTENDGGNGTRDAEFVNQFKNMNSYLPNRLKRHFIIDRAHTAIPDSSECRVKQNLIHTTDQLPEWENLPYDQTGRATVPVIIYQEESPYFNENTTESSNNNNDLNNCEEEILKPCNSQCARWPRVKYQESNSNSATHQSISHNSDLLTRQQQETGQDHHQQSGSIQVNSSNHNEPKSVAKTNSKIIFFQKEGKQIYYRSPASKTISPGKFPRRINLTRQLINSNNNEKGNQSNESQQSKMITEHVTNHDKVLSYQNQAIKSCEYNKSCQTAQNGYDNSNYLNNDHEINKLGPSQTNSSRSGKNNNVFRRKSEVYICRIGDLTEIKPSENSGNVPNRNSYYENCSQSFEKQTQHNKKPLLSSVCVFKEEISQTEIPEKALVWMPNKNPVNREVTARKSAMKPQDLRSNIHYQESGNNVIDKNDSRMRYVHCSNGYTDKRDINQYRNTESSQKNHNSLINNVLNNNSHDHLQLQKPGRLNWAYGIAIRNTNLKILLHTLNKVVEKNHIDYVRLNPYCILCTHVNHHHNHMKSNNNQTIKNSSQINYGKRHTDSNKKTSSLKWEIEVVHLPRFQTYGIRFKPIDGDLIQYRSIEKSLTIQLVQAMNDSA